jgi:hypothetical protein
MNVTPTWINNSAAEPRRSVDTLIKRNIKKERREVPTRKFRIEKTFHLVSSQIHRWWHTIIFRLVPMGDNTDRARTVSPPAGWGRGGKHMCQCCRLSVLKSVWTVPSVRYQLCYRRFLRLVSCSEMMTHNWSTCCVWIRICLFKLKN